MLSLSTRAIARRGATLADALRTGRELGFKAVSIPLAGPAPRAGAIAAAQAETGSRVASLRAGCLDGEGNGRQPTEELGSLDDGKRARALAAARDHVALAKAVGCGVVVIDGGAVEGAGLDDRVRRLEGEVDRGAEPGELLEEIRISAERTRLAHLDKLCRSLHELVRRHDGLRFALLVAARPHGIATARTLDDVLDDLKASNLSAWIDVGRAKTAERLGGPPVADLLAAFAPRLAGVDLHDARGLAEHLAPGDGEVDWRAVAENVPAGALRVLDLDGGAAPAAIVEIRRVVESLGL